MIIKGLVALVQMNKRFTPQRSWVYFPILSLPEPKQRRRHLGARCCREPAKSLTAPIPFRLSPPPPRLVPASVYKRTYWLVRSPELFLKWSRGTKLGLNQGPPWFFWKGRRLEWGRRSPFSTIQFGMVRGLLRVYIAVLSQFPPKLWFSWS